MVKNAHGSRFHDSKGKTYELRNDAANGGLRPHTVQTGKGCSTTILLFAVIFAVAFWTVKAVSAA